MPPPTPITAAPMLAAREPGKVTGAPLIRPCSLPAAMIDPENVTAPMSTSRTVVTVVASGTPAVAPASLTYSLIATSAAAPPPTALNRLTSWGMAVICTVRAEYSPAPAPTSAPATITIQPVAVTVPACTTRANVVAIARAMPAVDTWLPRRAVAGEFIRCRPSTKQTAAATYSSWVTQSKVLLPGLGRGPV